MREALLFLAGVLTWTLLEYLIHRFVAHHDHRVCQHHVDPLDYSVGPSWSLITLYLLTPVVLCSVLGIMWAWVGLVAGFAIYAGLHYAMHHTGWFCRAPRWLRTLCLNHLAHHYFDDTKNYGVTSPLWDLVFLTYRRRS